MSTSYGRGGRRVRRLRVERAATNYRERCELAGCRCAARCSAHYELSARRHVGSGLPIQPTFAASPSPRSWPRTRSREINRANNTIHSICSFLYVLGIEASHRLRARPAASAAASPGRKIQSSRHVGTLGSDGDGRARQ